MRLSSRRLKSCLRSGRHATATAALFAYLLAVAGVPLPAGPQKDRSRPFPCMDRPCGCKDAAQCWTSCCCTTPRERLAWARQQGIEPPSALAVLAIVRRGGGESSAAMHQHARRSCCAAKAKAASPRAAGAEKSASAQGDLVAIGAWRACHGLGALWSFHGAALAPAPALTYEFDWSLAERLAARACMSDSLVFSPPVPPPRA
jgi:hypothetical protein